MYTQVVQMEDIIGLILTQQEDLMKKIQLIFYGLKLTKILGWNSMTQQLKITSLSNSMRNVLVIKQAERKVKLKVGILMVAMVNQVLCCFMSEE